MRKIHCNESEKETVWKTILKMIDLIQTVRKEGLLYLEELAQEEKDFFLRSCLRYITETNPVPEELCEYVAIWLMTEDVSDMRRLEMAVIGDGLEQLLLQRAPDVALRRLGAWLGAGYADRVEEMIVGMNQARRKKQTESLEAEFDRLLNLSEEQLSLLLEKSDDDMLALALMGASDAVVERVEAVVSLERWKSITESYAPYPRACDVRAAQRNVLGNL